MGTSSRIPFVFHNNMLSAWNKRQEYQSPADLPKYHAPTVGKMKRFVHYVIEPEQYQLSLGNLVS